MLLNPLPALVTSFPRASTIKDEANNGRHSPFCPFPDIVFINEETTGCINEEMINAINEAVRGVIIAPRNPPSCFLISCLIIPEVPSINRPEFSSDSTILIISSISSFEMNKANTFPALTAPVPLVFLSNLSNTNEVALVANLGEKILSQKNSKV